MCLRVRIGVDVSMSEVVSEEVISEKFGSLLAVREQSFIVTKDEPWSHCPL